MKHFFNESGASFNMSKSNNQINMCDVQNTIRLSCQYSRSLFYVINCFCHMNDWGWHVCKWNWNKKTKKQRANGRWPNQNVR